MSERILFVDDEPMVLDGLSRKFRKKLDLVTAIGPVEGLATINREGPFGVVVSDFKMPDMHGVDFLNRVKERMPDAARILLTGYADVSIAMQAVNEGAVFRFLSKPCPDDLLMDSIKAGFQHHNLLQMKDDLLSRTVVDSLDLFAEHSSRLPIDQLSRVVRMRRFVREIGTHLGVSNFWCVEMAVFLSVTWLSELPATLVTRISDGSLLTPEDINSLEPHIEESAKTIGTIPHLSAVADIFRSQFSAVGSVDLEASDLVSRGASILKVVRDYEYLVSSGNTPQAAVTTMSQRANCYVPTVLDALTKLTAETPSLVSA